MYDAKLLPYSNDLYTDAVSWRHWRSWSKIWRRDGSIRKARKPGKVLHALYAITTACTRAQVATT